MHFYKKKLFNISCLFIIVGLFGNGLINGLVVNNPPIETKQSNAKNEGNNPKIGINSEIHNQKNDNNPIHQETLSQTKISNLQSDIKPKKEIIKENISNEEHGVTSKIINEIKNEDKIEAKEKVSVSKLTEIETGKTKEKLEGESTKEKNITNTIDKQVNNGMKKLKTKGKEKSTPNFNSEKLKLEEEINKAENVLAYDNVKSINTKEKSAENIFKQKVETKVEEKISSANLMTENMKPEDNITKTLQNTKIMEKPKLSITSTNENNKTDIIEKSVKNIYSTKESIKAIDTTTSSIKVEIPTSVLDINNKPLNTKTVISDTKVNQNKVETIPFISVVDSENTKPKIIESINQIGAISPSSSNNSEFQVNPNKKSDLNSPDNLNVNSNIINTNSTSSNLPKQNFVLEAKTYFDNLLTHPMESTYNLTALVIKPFTNVYSTLSKPNEKAEKNFFSQHVLPTFKVFCFFSSIISIFAFTIYSSMVAGKMLANKFYPKSDSEENKSTFFKKKLNLKGRTKKNPNNINYNDLFKDNEEKHQILKKGKTSIERDNDIENDLEDKHCKNLDDFLERVNEKREFQKFFNDGNSNMNSDSKVNRNFNQTPIDSKQISVVLKNNEENLILFDDQMKKNLRKPTEVKFVQKEIEKEILFDNNNYDVLENKYLENSTEIRNKNPSLYHKTPLANIRKNTMSSQK